MDDQCRINLQRYCRSKPLAFADDLAHGLVALMNDGTFSRMAAANVAKRLHLKLKVRQDLQGRRSHLYPLFGGRFPTCRFLLAM